MKHTLALVIAILVLAPGCKKDDKAPAGAGSAAAGSASGSATSGSATAGSAAAGGTAAIGFPAPLLDATRAMSATVAGIIAALAAAADCDAKAKVLTDWTPKLKPVADKFQAEYEKLDPATSEKFDTSEGEKMVAEFEKMGPHLEACNGHPGVTAAATEFMKIGQ